MLISDKILINQSQRPTVLSSQGVHRFFMLVCLSQLTFIYGAILRSVSLHYCYQYVILENFHSNLLSTKTRVMDRKKFMSDVH